MGTSGGRRDSICLALEVGDDHADFAHTACCYDVQLPLVFARCSLSGGDWSALLQPATRYHQRQPVVERSNGWRRSAITESQGLGHPRGDLVTRCLALHSNGELYRLMFTGKERDAETGLDYFGARYMASTQGRFISPDPKMMSGRHIEYPQKWNEYGFVQNNPLSRIDPNGEDDYKVFAPDSRIKGNWATARRAVEANGHTFQVYEGKDASVNAFVSALGDKNARVVYVGHTTHDENGKISGLALSDGIVSGEGAQVQTKDSDFTIMPVDVNANTVCILACDSANIDKDFQKTEFYGVDSGKNKVTSVDAMTPAAAAFTGAHAAKNPATGRKHAGSAPDPVKRANEALRRNQRHQDLDGDKVVKP